MNQEGATVLQKAKDWLTQNVVETTKTTVGYICNIKNNKLVKKATLLLEQYGKQIQYVDPVSELLLAIEDVLQRKFAKAA